MAGPTVLIADNDRAVGGLLREVLLRGGCTVHAAADGEEAMAVLGRGGIDVLVCDLDMPRASGQDVLAWLRGRPRPPAVVVVSGYVDAVSRRQLEADPLVAAVMAKPFDLFAFQAAVCAAAAPGRGGTAGADAP